MLVVMRQEQRNTSALRDVMRQDVVFSKYHNQRNSPCNVKRAMLDVIRQQQRNTSAMLDVVLLKYVAQFTHQTIANAMLNAVRCDVASSKHNNERNAICDEK